ncbi:MAG: right-handed parallel beta-helix repeat-containing protein [Gimesia sp.]
MKRVYLAFLIAFCVPTTLCAQPIDPAFEEPGFENENYGGDASELFGDSAWFGRYRPHVGYRYEAGDTIGRIGGLSSFDAFFPLLEGEDGDWLTFIDARLLLGDDNHNLGSNIGFGARQYIPEYQSTIGGYIYHDTRDAGYANFSQVSGGVEILGDFWEARLNWYVPTGTRRKQWGAGVSGTGNYYYSGHSLYGGTLTRYYQAAMTGVDMEAGRKILTGFNTDVRAFAGWYHFQAQGSQQAWGWKSRLESRISDIVALNLSIQNDRIFDTTVNFAVSFQWPSITGLRNGPKSGITARDRLGESPERLRAIVVDNQELQSANHSQIINPTTGNPYYFMHVANGGNSDGSYEDPYATLTAAFADARTQAGDVVVFDHRNTSETGTFTLANNTQVLSSGPAQFINTQFGQQQLLDSNTGFKPQITGNFTLNNGSVLSGFEIIGSGGNPAVIANGIKNITIANNTITNSMNSGIAVNNSQGISIRNNTLQDVSDDAIEITSSYGNITISENTIKSVTRDFDDAISVTINGNASLDIDKNIISSTIQPSEHGILITTSSGDVITRIRNNQITGLDFSLPGGIEYTGNSTGMATTTITGNTILNEDGPASPTPAFNPIIVRYNAGSANTMISHNAVASEAHASSGSAIQLFLNTTGTTNTTLDQNIISDPTSSEVFAYGIIAEVNQGTDHDIFITNNKIGPNLYNIRADVKNGAAARMKINQNIFIDNSNTVYDLLIYADNPGAQFCLEIQNNTAFKPFDFNTNGIGIIKIENLPGLSANNNGVPIQSTGSLTNIADCFP